MLRNVRFNNIADAEAISRAAGLVYNPLSDACIARITPKGYLLGGVVYTGYTGRGGSVCFHVASFRPKWITRDFLWLTFDYPFSQLDVRKIFGQVKLGNEAVMRVARHVGFKQEAYVRDVYPDGDMIILSMYRADCMVLDEAPRLLKGR